jgi:hypothetical protein
MRPVKLRCARPEYRAGQQPFRDGVVMAERDALLDRLRADGMPVDLAGALEWLNQHYYPKEDAG